LNGDGNPAAAPFVRWKRNVQLNNKNNKIGKAHRSNMISQPIFASFTLVQHSTQRKLKEILRIDKKANHNLEPRTSN